MLVRNLVLLIPTLLGMGLSACTRPSNESSQAQVALPPQLILSKQLEGSLTDSFDRLEHVVINISGDGIPEPILLTWDSCRGCPNAPSRRPASPWTFHQAQIDTFKSWPSIKIVKRTA